jgi:hypothetical protein
MEPDGVSSPPRSPNLAPLWVKGQSGNPLGHATSRLTLARYIRQRSGDGEAFVEFLFSVMRGEPIPLPATNGHRRAGRRPSIDQQLRAVELLLDRGWGRSKEILEVHDPDAARAQRLTLFASMPTEDRDTIAGLLRKALEAQNRAAPVEAIPPSSSVSLGETGRADAPLTPAAD